MICHNIIKCYKDSNNSLNCPQPKKKARCFSQMYPPNSCIKCKDRNIDATISIYESAVSFHVDEGCIVVDKSVEAGLKKCDFLVISDNNAVFVELKGTACSTAIRQILSTYEIYKMDLGARTLYAIISCKGVSTAAINSATGHTLCRCFKNGSSIFSKSIIITG